MTARGRRLIGATMVYGLGEALNRFANLLLLPLFTAYLSPADYGIIALLAFIPFLARPVFSLGLDTAVGIAYFERPDDAHRSAVIWTAIAILGASVAVLLATALPGAGALSRLVLRAGEHATLVTLAVLSGAASILVQPFMQRLQFQGRARLYVLLSAVSTLSGIGLAVVLVVGSGRGVRGWVEADLAAKALTLALFALPVIVAARPRFDRAVAGHLLRLGLPMVPSFAFVFVLQQGNKYILQLISGLAALGVYNVGFNLGMAALGMPVAAFQRAWMPHFMSFIDRPEDARIAFGRVMTWYVFGFGTLSLLAFIVARPVVMIMTQPEFHGAYQSLGLAAAAQFVFGAFLVLLPGPYFARDVRALALTQAAAALISVVVNALLIARFGILGAGLGLVAGAVAQALLQLRRNRRRAYLEVTYDARALVRFGVLYLIVGGLMLVPRDFSLTAELALSAGAALVVVPMAFLLLGSAERDRARALAGRLRSRPATDPSG
jgi:O-antigen/teichoic acid export membrane protein